ncbi:MAG: cell division protein FtsQ/DivIB [Aquificaceae bacterium]
MKKGRRGKWLSYLIVMLWFSSMALAGFFIPYFIDSISFFKIRVLQVEGLETIPPHVVAEEVKKLKNNWLFINKYVLLKNINMSTGNAVKDVDITRKFSTGGVDLKITIKERKPVFSVINNNSKIFFDEDGKMFQSPYINYSIPLIYTYDIELINKNFNTVKSLINLLNSHNALMDMYITEINTIAYLTNGTKLILPPLLLIDQNMLKIVSKLLKDYNISIYKELEIGADGLIIMRGEKGNETNNLPRHRYH